MSPHAVAKNGGNKEGVRTENLSIARMQGNIKGIWRMTGEPVFMEARFDGSESPCQSGQ